MGSGSVLVLGPAHQPSRKGALALRSCQEEEDLRRKWYLLGEQKLRAQRAVAMERRYQAQNRKVGTGDS